MKISITLANYNHGRYLDTYFEGILGQTYANWELIVTDDGSTDNSREIIRRYAARDARIKVFEFPVNQGSMPAFYNCFAHATGELVYATASDDYLVERSFFEKAVDAFKRHPDLGVYFGTEEIRDASDGTLLGLDGRAPANGYVDPVRCMEGFLRKELLIPGCCSVLRKKWIDEQQGYPVELGPWCDYYLNHAVAGKHGAYFDNTLYAYARLDPAKKNLSTRLSLEQMLANNFMICRRLMSDGFFGPISHSMVKEWIHHEIRQSVSWAFGCIWTLQKLDESVRNQQMHGGLGESFRTLLTGDFAEALRTEQERVANQIARAVSAIDRQIQTLVPDYQTELQSPSFAGVLAFVNDRREMRKQIATRLTNHSRQIRQYEKVVIYGMGSHSTLLLEEWKWLGLPPISAMTSSDAMDGGRWGDIPVVSIQSLAGAKVLVVLSSLSFEAAMFAHLKNYLPECSTLSIWNPNLTRM